MGRLARAWNGFWFAEGPVVGLGLFRILFAGCLLAEIPTSRAKSVNAIDDGGFHLPYLDWIPAVPEAVYSLLHDLQIPLILLLALGLYARTSCGVQSISGSTRTRPPSMSTRSAVCGEGK